MSEMKEMILQVVERMLKDNVDKDLVDVVEQGKWSPNLWSLFEENGIQLLRFLKITAVLAAIWKIY